MAGKKATATPKRASKTAEGAAPSRTTDKPARRGNPVVKTDEKEGTSQHFITLPLSASARLMQAVNAEKLRRHVAGDRVHHLLDKIARIGFGLGLGTLGGALKGPGLTPAQRGVDGQRLPQGLAQGPAGQDFHHLPPILRAAAEVGHGAGSLQHRPRRCARLDRSAVAGSRGASPG